MGDIFGISLWWILAGVGALLVAVVLLAVVAGALKAVLGGKNGTELDRARAGSRQWASVKAIRRDFGGQHLANPSRLYLGEIPGKKPKAVNPGKDFAFGGQNRSVLVLAPTGGGKTPRIVVPNVLRHTGPAVVTSVKSDVAALTWAKRAELGRVWLFDPAEDMGRGTARWSPLDHVTDYATAIDVAAWIIDAGRGKADTSSSNDEFWAAVSERLLGPLLLAAKSTEKTMLDVVDWVASPPEEFLRATIEDLGVPRAVLAWSSYEKAEERTRANMLTSTQTILKAWAHPVLDEILDTRGAGADVIDVHSLVQGHADGSVATLYLVAASNRQEILEPIFSTLLNAIWAEVENSYQARSLPLAKPLLMMLDEAANIAKVRKLGAWASSGASMGLLLVSVWQNEGQLEEIYGPPRARTIINNHTAKIYLTGIDDEQTLESLSRRIGKDRRQRVSRSVGRDGTSYSYSEEEFDVAPVDVLASSAKADEAIVVVVRHRPMRLTVPGWWERPLWRSEIPADVAAAFDSAFASKRRKPTKRKVSAA